MELEEHLLGLEEQFWKGDADFYRLSLTDDSLMVFAEPIGILTKDRTIETLASSPRWGEIRFEDVHMVQLAEDSAIVAYKAVARREGAGSGYSALVSSAYVRRGGSWKLAFHQHTPSDSD